MMLLKVKEWLTKVDKNPVPLRTMKVVQVVRRTEKAIMVKLQGTPSPSGECMHCGREITNPTSLHFGIGSTCIQKYPHLLATINEHDIEKSYQRLKEEMHKITWEGWLPKSSFQFLHEEPTADDVKNQVVLHDIVFMYDNQIYHVQTEKEEKIARIKQNAQEIIKFEMIAL